MVAGATQRPPASLLRGSTANVRPAATDVPRAASMSGERERPFTDAELLRLLASPPDATLADFMLTGALTGMRREEIGRLTVADGTHGVIIVQRARRQPYAAVCLSTPLGG